MTETRDLTIILVFNIPTIVHPFESIFVQGERKRLILSDSLDDNLFSCPRRSRDWFEKSALVDMLISSNRRWRTT